MTMYLELSDQKHHKFYELTLDSMVVKVDYGKIGRAGRRSLKHFPTISEALRFAQKQVWQKLRRGYQTAYKGLTEPRARGVHPRQLQIQFL